MNGHDNWKRTLAGWFVHPGRNLSGRTINLIERRELDQFRIRERGGVQATDFAIGPADERPVIQGAAAQR